LYGSDVDSDMVDGAQENLEAFDLDADIREAAFSDVEAAFDAAFDAIVTDLPYGKASKVEDDPTEAFVEAAPDLADSVVFISNRDDLGPEPAFEIFVHRSMDRYVYVLD
ncbi:MAG: hypothetical protein SVW02_00430, partial [Candidatus Nanohaloarchaea archaeon]|nr:hypothetical protein [Candidatus Nanohaloarchaea archaeon]